jgi:hypothetical protein
MTPTEIITQEAQTYGGDADVLLRSISKLAENNAAILLQKNDSVLMLISIAEGIVELHLFTMDRPAKVADSLKYFIEKIRASDLKMVYGPGNRSQNEKLNQTLKLLKRMGIDVQKSDLPGYAWMAKV